jgi:hypothetical protein
VVVVGVLGDVGVAGGRAVAAAVPRALILPDAVAFGVVDVVVRAVGREFIVGAGRVAPFGAVAVGVVGVGLVRRGGRFPIAGIRDGLRGAGGGKLPEFRSSRVPSSGEFRGVPGTPYTIIDSLNLARLPIRVKSYVWCPPNSNSFSIIHDALLSGIKRGCFQPHDLPKGASL